MAYYLCLKKPKTLQYFVFVQLDSKQKIAISKRGNSNISYTVATMD